MVDGGLVGEGGDGGCEFVVGHGKDLIFIKIVKMKNGRI